MNMNYCSAETILKHAKFEVSMVVKIQVEVFWVVMLCGVAVGY
jgi:allophanate hydrolase subunit 1